MCIAIVKPKDKDITKDILKNCSENNPDGCGMAWIEDDEIKTFKSLDFEEFYKEYQKHCNKSNMILHFRVKTHGIVCVDNCHPFKLNDKMALVHNGIISGYGDRDKKVDTQDFIEKVIGNIGWKMWKSPSFRELVGKAIGSSKFGILSKTGECYIINSHLGNIVDGIWYSNKSYEKKKETSSYDYSKWYRLNDYYYDSTNKEYVYKNKRFSSWKSLMEFRDKEKIEKQKQEDEYSIIYKCKFCGEETIAPDSKEDVECEVCKNDNLEEVGFVEDGKKYYYTDYCYNE